MKHTIPKKSKSLKIFFSAIFFTTISPIIFSGCETNTTLHQYPFQTAKIEYKISGSTDGKTTLTIKGDRSIKETHAVFHKPANRESKAEDIVQDNLLIDDGTTITSIDLNKKIGSTTVNPSYKNLSELDPSLRQDYLKKLAVGYSPEDALTKELKLIGRTEFAGQRCEIYSTTTFGQICLWNAIPLRTTSAFLDINSDILATMVETNIEVPDAVFEIPKDIKVTDNTNLK